MRKCIYFVCVAGIIFCSCKKYQWSLAVCNTNLYVENFNVNPLGSDAHYLTDSLTFRFEVGEYDNEHEIFIYSCSIDSVKIVKLGTNSSGDRFPIDSTSYSFQELKRKGF